MMQRWIKTQPDGLWWVQAVILLLLLPALFWNLGLMPLLADEPTRALVALEMWLRGDWVVATIMGEYYYNKPPLYNWLLLGILQWRGELTEWWIRLPAVVSLLGFALCQYWWFREVLTRRWALLVALLFVLNARMLSFDSLLGHIDLTFAWVTFLSFWVIYKDSTRGQFTRLFVLSYALAGAGFLMKGLPSVLFQGFTLVAALVLRGQWMRLFGWRHVLGLGAFAAVVGAYLAAYGARHSLSELFATLWDQSSQRTITQKPWHESLLHLLTFPLEHFVHLLPASLLAVLLLRKGAVASLWWSGQPLLQFSFLMLALNLTVYWLAPETYPRYLFPLYPFVLLLLGYAAQTTPDKFTWPKRVLHGLFCVAGGVLVLGLWLPLGLPGELGFLPYRVPVAVGLGLAGLGVWLLLWRKPAWKWELLLLLLVVGRLGFDAFVLPQRHHTSPESQYKAAGLAVARITQGEPLLLFGESRINQDIAYYISHSRGDVLRYDLRPAPQTGVWYLINDFYRELLPYEPAFVFYTRYENRRVWLVKVPGPLVNGPPGHLGYHPDYKSIDATVKRVGR